MDDRTVKDIIREELGKLKTMTWGQRLQYIWDYYKPLMVVILLIIFAVSIGVSIYQNMQLNQVFTTYWVNSAGMVVDTEGVETLFRDYVGGLGEKDVVTVDTSVNLNNDTMGQYAMASQMKLTTLIATGDIDLVLFDEESYRQFLTSGGLLPVSDFCTQEQFLAWQKDLVEDTQTVEDLDGTQTSSTDYFAVRVTDSPVLAAYNAYMGGEVYAVFVPAGKHPETACRFIDFLLGAEGSSAA